MIGVDADVESNIVKYNVPSISYRPERYIPYTVVEKKTSDYTGTPGGSSEWPFNYTLIETDKYEDYLSGNYMISKDSAKLLFPWIYKWISVDTPMATNVDRKTISEHQETQLNPELEVGDIIKVISVDGEHARMPELFTDYKVVNVENAYPLMTKRNRGNEQYYDIVPYPEVELSDVLSLSDTLKIPDRKTLYRGDKWIRSWKEEIPKYLKEQMSFMDKSDQAMEKARKEALRRGLFNSLDTLFDVLPYEEGEIVHNDVNMGVYNKETGQFVPVDYIYDPIMENMGMQVTEDDLQLFIDIITEWVNMRMSSHNIEEYVN